jgi:thiol:disulfide interchange protein DsbC
VPRIRTTIEWLLVPLCFALPAASIGDENAESKPLSKEELAAKLHNVSPSDITESPVDGLYQVALGSNVAYVTSDGRYVFDGEIIELQSGENLTENTRARARVGLLASIDEDDMIVFSPKNGDVKHTITIFTDIDCGYCRQFHREIDKVNALGIEVHYLFFPRTGRNTESWEKADKVWCTADRNTALTRAKLGGAVPDASCADTPIEAHYALGQRVGVRGTPAIFSETGELLGGYLPPATLLERLDNAVASPE